MRNVGGGQACTEIVPQEEPFIFDTQMLGYTVLESGHPPALHCWHTTPSLYLLMASLMISRLNQTEGSRLVWWALLAVLIVYHFLHFPINAAPVLTSNIHTPQEEVTSPPPVKMDLR